MQLVDHVMALGAAIRYAALAHDADIDTRPLNLLSRRAADIRTRDPTQVVDAPTHR